ncbi:hypothetical protein A8B79_00090 [Balneola sp. EhC07]|uniref:WD40/YVTN/BNR-like repeat-containing protein n=1 Tax=Balneola sp. EhC07 TaxID=1849360 RepID=UPI0007F4885E|nr:hypothetical protein [Balneola sp. EhC07]OAN64581.1 hypothetical protein A8B79_00090 [Balneola sp. EhC07]
MIKEDSQPGYSHCTDLISPNEWTSLGLSSLEVTAIETHPNKSDVIYAGTSSDFSTGTEGQLFKTTNCGKNWELLLQGGSFREIQINPKNTDIIYVTNGNIYKSIDNGKNWDISNDGINFNGGVSVSTIHLNAKNPETLYAGTSGNFKGSLYKSHNGGKNWSEIQGIGLKENWFKAGVSSISLSPFDSNTIYVGTTAKGDILLSSDGGNTWKESGLFDTGTIVHSILISPLRIQDSIISFAGLNNKGLYRSQNDGQNWNLVTNDFLSDTTSIVEIEYDNHKNSVLVITTYNDSGNIFEYDIINQVWNPIPSPIINQSFYYSKLKVYNINNTSYQYFGTNGLFLKTEE